MGLLSFLFWAWVMKQSILYDGTNEILSLIIHGVLLKHLFERHEVINLPKDNSVLQKRILKYTIDECDQF